MKKKIKYSDIFKCFFKTNLVTYLNFVKNEFIIVMKCNLKNSIILATSVSVAFI